MSAGASFGNASPPGWINVISGVPVSEVTERLIVNTPDDQARSQSPHSQYAHPHGYSDSEREAWPLRYLEAHGGICMGMIRFAQHSQLFANEDGLDDLYGLRYVDALLRRDEPERALTSFYGKLAQGMTRDTFLSAEGTSLRPLDAFGRPMYLPPNCSGNALFLWTLRSLLVQDYDLDNDGTPESLRLLFATPRHWLEDGKTIRVERAPTAFGEVSLRVESKLARGEVLAQIHLPERNPARQSWLRLRLPEGWKIQSARVEGRTLSVDDDGTMALSGLTARHTIRCQVKPAPAR